MTEGKRSSEHTRIRILRELFGDTAPGFDVALGDDCAVLSPVRSAPVQATRIVWSVDSSVEGTHFRRDLMTLEDVGYRATMAALSDLAAMGAQPTGIVSALILPTNLSDEDFFSIVRGQREAAADARTAIVGGNLARGDEISITTSVLGVTDRPLLRSGAREGEALYIAGELGYAAVGLRLAGSGKRIDDPLALRALEAYRRPRARLDDGVLAVRAGATSMIDVSDGLAADSGHVANESNVTIILDEEAVLATTSTRLCALAQRDALEVALTGGEDYALLATAPEGTTLPGFTRIGRCVARLEEPLYIEAGGEMRRVTAAGFDHFG
ncbi:MAG: thiamine-phosphate kinase [Polyangiaceae bacterium]|nr:thiamine-phosphate kinase [Polyangiaceae bacterium]